MYTWYIIFLWHHASVLASLWSCVMCLTTIGVIQESSMCLIGNIHLTTMYA